MIDERVMQMAGYVPETMAEVQAIIAKAYADSVLDAFSMTSELLKTAPVGSAQDIGEQLKILEELDKKTGKERSEFISLCNIMLTEMSLLTSYAKNKGWFQEENVEKLVKDIENYRQKLSELDEEISRNKGRDKKTILEQKEKVELLLDSLVAKVNLLSQGNVAGYVVDKQREISEGIFKLGDKTFTFAEGSRLPKFLMCVYDMVQNPSGAAIAEAEKAFYSVSQIKDVAQFGYDILSRLGRKYLDILEQNKRESELAGNRHEPHLPKVNLLMTASNRRRLLEGYRNGNPPSITHEPVVLSGPPGVGKTAMLREIANWVNLRLYSFSLPQMDSSSFGFPVYDPETGSAKRDLVADMKKVIESPGIVLLDEMNRAEVDMQGKLLTMLLDHQLSGLTIHPLSLVVGAENPISVDPHGTNMKSLALIDRATYIDISDYNMIVNGWLDWVKNTYKYAMEESDTLRTFVKFLELDPPIGARDILLKIPEDPEMELNFPTPRSIDKVLKDIARTNPDIDTVIKRVRMTVGNDMANRFMAFAKVVNNLPTLEELRERSKDVNPIIAAMAMEADVTINGDNVTVEGFEPGTFYAINGYDDGDNKFEPITKTFKEKSKPLPEYIESLTPKKGALLLEQTMNKLWRANDGRNPFTLGVSSLLSDMLVGAFCNHIRECIENKKDIDGNLTEDIIKIVCMFPNRNMRNTMLHKLESFIATELSPEEYKKFFSLKVKLANGKRVDLGTDEVSAIFKMCPSILYLERISKRYRNAGLEPERIAQVLGRKEVNDESRSI